MAVLSREALLGATKLPQETVHIPQLGGDVIVRGMTGRERDAFEASCFEGKGKKRDFNLRDVRAKLVVFCCIDTNGHRVFTDTDIDAIGAMRADVVDRLFSVAQRLSGMSEQDVEELGKPSASPIVGSGFSSGSRENSIAP